MPRVDAGGGVGDGVDGVLRQRQCAVWPHRIVVVEYFAGAIPADSIGAAGAGGGEHIDPAQGGQLDNEPAGDSTRAIDEQCFFTVNGQRLADHLLGGQRRHQKGRPRALVAQRHTVAQHLIVHTESARVGANGRDDPGSLDAERQRRARANVPTAGANDVVPVTNPSAANVDEDLVGCQRSRLVHFERLHFAAERADARYKHDLHYSPAVGMARVLEFGGVVVLVVAWTSSDLAGRTSPGLDEVAAALSFRHMGLGHEH
jgi:hypothetical protein